MIVLIEFDIWGEETIEEQDLGMNFVDSIRGSFYVQFARKVEYFGLV